MIITGKGTGLSQASLARKIGNGCDDWLTRVQVVKKGKQRFVAWVTVKGDKMYEFVDLFNKEKRIGSSTAALKRSIDCNKKVVLHGVKGKSVEDIKKLLGGEKVLNVLKKHNTAFVVMDKESYVQAAISGQKKIEVSRYVDRPHDPLKAVSKKLTKMYQELVGVVDELRQQISQLTKKLERRKVSSELSTESVPTLPNESAVDPTPQTKKGSGNISILDKVVAKSKVLTKAKKQVMERVKTATLYHEQIDSNLMEDENVDNDSDKEITSPQLNENNKRSARVTVKDAVTGKMPARLGSLNKGSSRLSVTPRRTGASDDKKDDEESARSGGRTVSSSPE